MEPQKMEPPPIQPLSKLLNLPQIRAFLQNIPLHLEIFDTLSSCCNIIRIDAEIRTESQEGINQRLPVLIFYLDGLDRVLTANPVLRQMVDMGKPPQTQKLKLQSAATYYGLGQKIPGKPQWEKHLTDADRKIIGLAIQQPLPDAHVSQATNGSLPQLVDDKIEVNREKEVIVEKHEAVLTVKAKPNRPKKTQIGPQTPRISRRLARDVLARPRISVKTSTAMKEAMRHKFEQKYKGLTWTEITKLLRVKNEGYENSQSAKRQTDVDVICSLSKKINN